ncbi:MAG TPA: SPOR domain-containing protein [Bdellovibrionota bacterium]|jgi:cell division protein FtsN
MADKPSLYVVEKKEVIILVVLFVLVTVLSFTLGVRYGESVGRKNAQEQQLASEEHGEQNHESGTGTLGKAEEPKAEAPAHGEAKDAGAKDAHADTHESPKDAHGEAKEPAKEAKSSPSEEAHESHGSAEKPADSHSPEVAAKSSSHAGSGADHDTLDKNSDEYLLNALKEAGVEPPGGKAPQDAKLPDSVKETKAAPPSSKPLPSRIRGGSYVIQVGSHPTRSEAESQVRQLKARKVQAEILSPYRDGHGEWHRVVIGSFKNKREAEREAGALKSRGSVISFFVWRLP